MIEIIIFTVILIIVGAYFWREIAEIEERLSELEEQHRKRKPTED